MIDLDKEERKMTNQGRRYQRFRAFLDGFAFPSDYCNPLVAASNESKNFQSLLRRLHNSFLSS